MDTFQLGELPWQILLVHAWGVTDQVSWNVPSWSISAEWFAYLCFPLVAYGLGRVREPRTLLLIAVSPRAGLSGAEASGTHDVRHDEPVRPAPARPVNDAHATCTCTCICMARP